MSAERVQTLVIGGGAAGLAAARTLVDRGVDAVLLEASDQPGGVIRSERRDGFLYERGPNTFRLTPPALGFVREAGVEAALVSAKPASRDRFLFHEGRLEPVPMSVGGFVTTPLLSGRAKLRMLAEPLIARGDGGEESVAQFTARRLGGEVATHLVGPFLVGVYAGDEHALGAEAVFPSLVDYERKAGSIVVGALRDRMAGGPRGAPGSWSAAGGLGALMQALARPLGERLQLEQGVDQVTPEDRGWHVEAEGRSWHSESLVLAVPADAAARLLAPHSPEASAIAAELEYAPMVAAALSVQPLAARQAIEGFGFLVPRAAGLDLLGALFMSRLFSGRAPSDRELVMAMIGGKRWPEAISATDEEILERVALGLDRTLGLRGGFEALEVMRWPRAVPQPGIGHPARIAAARRALAGEPRLELAGSWVDGASVADTLTSGHAAALRLLAR